MSLKDTSCPGCLYSGTSHLESCPNRYGVLNNGEGITINNTVNLRPDKDEIVQQIIPSSGTKLVCTSCGRADWHLLILRRRAGYLEGLCKQMDGAGCYPLASRRGCGYTYPEGFDCPKLAEYVVAVGEEEHRARQVCRDHIGEVIRNAPLYKIWPLED